MKDLSPYTSKKVYVSGAGFDIRGTLASVNRDSITVEYAEYLEEHADARTMDGIVIIPSRAIDYVQVV